MKGVFRRSEEIVIEGLQLAEVWERRETAKTPFIFVGKTVCGERGALVFPCDHYVDSAGTKYLAVFFAWGDLGAIKRQEGNGWINIWLNPQYYSPAEQQDAEQQRRHLRSI